MPSDDTLEKISRRLDECRVIGVRVLTEPPAYRGITVVARLRARARTNPTRLQEAALEALYRYFHPITGGPDGSGWPFGRPVQVGEVYAVLQSVRGLELVEDVRLFGADPITGQRGQSVPRLDLDAERPRLLVRAPAPGRGRLTCGAWWPAWPALTRSGAALPALYQDDAFAQRLTDALDEVLAPVFASLDGLASYLDPALAPDDFLEWLAGWVGVTLDETWPIERRRQLVADAARLYRSRGTVAGLAAQVAIYTGGEVEVEDNGSSAWSSTAGGKVPGTSAPSLRVRVTVDDPATVSLARLEAVVATAKPAHVPHTITVVGRGGRAARAARADSSQPGSGGDAAPPDRAADPGESPEA